jgi:Tfp pilus assembly protein PilO
LSAFLANRTARWSLGAAALCLVLLLAAWFLLISPRRDDAAAVRDQTTASDQQAQLLQIKLTQLQSQAADLPKQKAKLKEIAAQLTPDADVPQYLRDLQDTAVAAGVDLSSVTPGTPTLVTLTGSTAAAAAATGSGAGLGQSGDLVSLPMNLSLTGDYYQLSEWLKQLQTKVSRSYLISAFTLTPEGSTTSDGLSGASIDDPLAAAATSSPTSTAKGDEGATATATASSTDGTTGSDTSTATSTATSTTAPVTDWSLSLSGTVFVLLSDDSTLADVAADAAAAQASLGGTWTEVTPSVTATATATSAATPTTASTTAPTATAGNS